MTEWTTRKVKCIKCEKEETIRNPRPSGMCRICSTSATGKKRIGKKWEESRREKIMKWKRDNPSPKGPAHPRWKGGVSHGGTDYVNWAKSVYRRDEWRCQMCKSKGKKLHAHHIYTYASFPEKRLELDNGITLCFECHYRLHSKSRKCKDCGTRDALLQRVCTGCPEKRDILIPRI